MKTRLGIVIGAAALTACGHSVPFGEKLSSPWSYGPPFGAETKDNVEHHPHYPTSRERYALASEHGARHFDDYGECHAALRAVVSGHGAHQTIVEISSVESIGTYEEHGEAHEYRCAGAVLTHRSWCRGESHAEAGGDHKGRKKAEPEEGCGAH